MTYPVVFRWRQGPVSAGKLVLEADELVLEGGSVVDRVVLRIRFAQLREVRVGRDPDQRLNGHATLLLTGPDGTVQVQPLGLGLLGELTELLAALAPPWREPLERVAVILPLRPNRVAEAARLIAEGPPFDPATLGLSRHQVFLRAREAIFVFTGDDVRGTLERASHDPTLWRV